MHEVIDNRYTVIRKLGSGGMADVYLANDEDLERLVAIKILDKRFARDEEFISRFQRETRAAAGLNHPNIVNIHDRGRTDSSYYIAMEYLEGESLHEIISNEGGIDPTEVVSIAEQILKALQFAHERDVIHRDIKPHNMIMNDRGEVKVTDFGIARAGASSTKVTTTGSILGTANYMSPEQAAGKEVTSSSDLYSLGIVLYEMLTGQVPFDGDNLMTVAMKHLNETPEPPGDFVPEIPDQLDVITMKALAKNPQQRYENADEFLLDIEKLKKGRSVEPLRSVTGDTRLVKRQAPEENIREKTLVGSAGLPTGNSGIFCPGCGQYNDISASFCGGCGYDLASSAAAGIKAEAVAKGRSSNSWLKFMIPVVGVLLVVAIGAGATVAFMTRSQPQPEVNAPPQTDTRVVTVQSGNPPAPAVDPRTQQYISTIDQLVSQNINIQQEIVSMAADINSVAPYGITDSMISSIYGMENRLMSIQANANSLVPPAGFASAQADFSQLISYNLTRCQALYRGAQAWRMYNYAPQYNAIIDEGRIAKESYQSLYPVFENEYNSAKANAAT